jgi:hypothetical protein
MNVAKIRDLNILTTIFLEADMVSSNQNGTLREIDMALKLRRLSLQSLENFISKEDSDGTYQNCKA